MALLYNFRALFYSTMPNYKESKRDKKKDDDYTPKDGTIFKENDIVSYRLYFTLQYGPSLFPKVIYLYSP